MYIQNNFMMAQTKQITQYRYSASLCLKKKKQRRWISTLTLIINWNQISAMHRYDYSNCPLARSRYSMNKRISWTNIEQNKIKIAKTKNWTQSPGHRPCRSLGSRNSTQKAKLVEFIRRWKSVDWIYMHFKWLQSLTSNPRDLHIYIISWT